MRYLTYNPWPGQLNNTRMCYETALVLAYLTRRSLVMPAEYRRQNEPEVEAGRFRPLHPAECFRLETLDRIVPIMAREEYDAQVGAEAMRDRVDLELEPGSSVFCFPRIPSRGSAEEFRLRDFAVSRSRFLGITPEMESCRTLNLRSATIEHFYMFFYFSRAQDELECKQLIRDHVRFRSQIVEAAKGIAAALEKYCALHVRRNDFFRLYPHQNIAPHRLLKNVETRVPAGTRLYIATDETDLSFFACLGSRYELFFLDSFRSLIPEGLSQESLACVEQSVCAFADRFIGTNLSTFSAYITRLRGYHGAADQNTYFTDGSPGSEMDNEGSPPFSWIQWIRIGNPWWAREFREAWEF